jgi:hypothetical protein
MTARIAIRNHLSIPLCAIVNKEKTKAMKTKTPIDRCHPEQSAAKSKDPWFSKHQHENGWPILCKAKGGKARTQPDLTQQT